MNFKKGVVNIGNGKASFFINDQNREICFVAGEEIVSVFSEGKGRVGRVIFVDKNLPTGGCDLPEMGQKHLERLIVSFQITPTLDKKIQKGKELKIKRDNIFTLTIKNT
ncbi:MAG: hypothetical protein Q8O88_03150 [bacterium]|nr:hypothetical protein [bacterium]